jgi:hypothetical protein
LLPHGKGGFRFSLSKFSQQVAGETFAARSGPEFLHPLRDSIPGDHMALFFLVTIFALV